MYTSSLCGLICNNRKINTVSDLRKKNSKNTDEVNIQTKRNQQKLIQQQNKSFNVNLYSLHYHIGRYHTATVVSLCSFPFSSLQLFICIQKIIQNFIETAYKVHHCCFSFKQQSFTIYAHVFRTVTYVAYIHTHTHLVIHSFCILIDG